MAARYRITMEVEFPYPLLNGAEWDLLAANASKAVTDRIYMRLAGYRPTVAPRVKSSTVEFHRPTVAPRVKSSTVEFLGDD
jgi:hypothetical protein